ncbi:MAG: hypothetical protein AAF460_13740, partial [Pseudomonadota bacterium]
RLQRATTDRPPRAERLWRRWRHALAAAALTLAPLGLIAAPASLGPLAPYVQPAEDSTWRVQDDGHAATLENRGTEGAITYYYLSSPDDTLGKRRVSVDVALGSSTTWSLAGLLYGFDDTAASYFVFALGGDGAVHVLHIANGQAEEIDAFSVDDLSAAETTLTLEEAGRQVTLMVNGTVVGRYEDARLGRGDVGILAGDVGQYTFSNFVLETTDAPARAVTRASGTAAPTSTPSDSGNRASAAAASAAGVQPESPPASYAKPRVELRYFPSRDAKLGVVSLYTPFPATWSQQKGNREFGFFGPNGVKVSNAFGQLFSFTSYADGQQILFQQNTPNTPPMSIEQIIDRFFMPTAREHKRELVRHYPLPGLTQLMREFQARLFKAVPVQETVSSYAMEWRDDAGLSYITTLTVTVSEAFPISTWYFNGQYMQAETAHFAAARDAYLYGVEHTETNPRWIQLTNERDARRAGRSWAAHQSRMAAIQSRAEASRSVADIYNEISDISHAGFLERSDMVSQGQAASVRGIAEQTLIGDQRTGERYTVDGQSQYHWVNTNGVYVGTDNPAFDPRTDRRLNMFDWTRFQAER